MARLPFVLNLEEDELLYSYVLRLAKANGFDDFYEFLYIYFFNKRIPLDKIKQTTSYDLRFELYDFLSNLNKRNFKSLDFYMETSMFPGISPLMTKGLASHHIGLISKSHNNSSIITPLTNMITEIKYCPECIRENKLYFQRAHQMPGVTICIEHCCGLCTSKNITDFNKLDLTNSFPYNEKSHLYAEFCEDILYGDLDTDVSTLIDAIKRSNYELDRITPKKLDEYMSDFGFSDMLDYSPCKFLSAACSNSVTYVNMVTCLAILYFSFNTSKYLKSYITKDTITEKIFKNEIKNKYMLLSPYKNSIVELQCYSCKTRFITTPHRIISGWGCPKCDARYSDQELFEHLFKKEGNNEYSLLSAYTSMGKSIKIKHHKCGKIYSISPRRFIEEQSKCPCENFRSNTDIKKQIEASGKYKLIKYTNSATPVIIKHLECGSTFDFRLEKFLNNPNCKVCNPKNHTTSYFKKQMYDLVGDEYELIGKFKNSTTKVSIKHNKCGTIQEYKPGHFLDGLRCSKCKHILKVKDFKRIVSEVSYGKYICEEKVTANLYAIRNTETNEIIQLTMKKTIQELFRYKPSPILPLEKRNLNVSLISTDVDKLLHYINSNYTKDDFIFMEDVNIPSVSYTNIKKYFSKLCNDKIIKLVYRGIYVFYDKTYELNDVINAKYINRNNNYIGYLAGKSLAYKLGLRTNKPNTLELITNKEANTHGRFINSYGVSIKIHGPRVEINNSNHIILATLNFILSYKHFKYVDTGNVNLALYKWLQDNNITLSDFEPYYQYYATYSKSLIEAIYKEGENA